MKKQKTSTNKGFSLVELIIVVAIMAILLAILVPQYVRYVERSRLQKDNSSIGEFVNTIKIASADEEIVDAMIKAMDGNGGKIEFEFYSDVDPHDWTNAQGKRGVDFKPNADSNMNPLIEELEASLGILDHIGMNSNAYSDDNNPPTITITVNSDGVMQIEATNWVEKPGAGTTTKKF